MEEEIEGIFVNAKTGNRDKEYGDSVSMGSQDGCSVTRPCIGRDLQ
jgi:hypothetical protein